MYKYLLPLVIVLFASVANSQNIVDSITYAKNFGGYKYYLLGTELSNSDVLSMLENNDEAALLYSNGLEARVFGGVFCVAGISLIAAPIIATNTNSEIRLAMALSGVSLIGLSFPLFRSYNKKTLRAVKMYNSALKIQGNQTYTGYVNLKISANGAGIIVKF